MTKRRSISLVLIVVSSALLVNGLCDSRTSNLVGGNRNEKLSARGSDGTISLGREEDRNIRVKGADSAASDTSNFSSAAQVVGAVRAGAVSYDENLLATLRLPTKDCTWCDEFYGQLRQEVENASTSADEREYFLEILATSGRVENVSFLLDGLRREGQSNASDVYGQALEYAIGDEAVVNYLGNQLADPDPRVHEAALSALSNHGTIVAVELLYKEALSRPDSEEAYALGVGLGEVTPDVEALPRLVEIATRGDDCAHLAFKALLNEGLAGLQEAVSVVGVVASHDDDKVVRLIQDAPTHIRANPEVVSYLNSLTGSNEAPAVISFARLLLESLPVERSTPQSSL